MDAERRCGLDRSAGGVGCGACARFRDSATRGDTCRRVKLDMIQTVALASVVLFIGYGIRRRVGVLDRFNIPAPVVGGFLFAAAALALRQAGILAFEFDTALQTPFMVAFFTTIGLGASLGLLRIGGPQVLLFWLLASVLAAVQNGVGLGLATVLGVDPLLGLITGSIT